ncbi:MAG: spermidine synthase [Deltaproteobacteria bacterium]|nr:spermidine synthase [Deltaproteobacteria bacterium]
MRIRYRQIDEEVTSLGTLSLHRYEAETGERGYEVRIDDQFLMATHGSLGESAMARLAYERLARQKSDLTVLVGGLGAGHTLQAALGLAGIVAVEVVEIGHKVVEWNRRYFTDHGGQALADARVRVTVADLGDVLAERQDAYDLLLLDVDNGPGWLAAADNARLYESTGIEQTRSALRLGGVLAVWSPAPNGTFREALAQVFTEVEEVRTREVMDEGAGPTDVVYLAVRQSPG